MVAREAPADVRGKAQELARQHVEARETADIIDRYRDIVNFDFWRATCEAEVTEPMLRAREATWRADRDFQNARLQAAKKAYEQAFAAWREVLDGSPVLREEHARPPATSPKWPPAIAGCSSNSTNPSRAVHPAGHARPAPARWKIRIHLSLRSTVFRGRQKSPLRGLAGYRPADMPNVPRAFADLLASLSR